MLSLFVGAVLLNLYAAGLIVARAAVYRTKLYRPMLWNVLLSVAPVLILLLALLAWGALLPVHPVLANAVLVVMGAGWLLMLPNASYLITELNLSHRKGGTPVPLWYDIILVITLAMSGVANAVLNVFIAQLVVALIWFDDTVRSLTRPAVLTAVVVVFVLLGLGMYLGRYLRLNSWDVRHPGGFARKVGAHFRARQNVGACIGFTVTYALFLAIIYLIVIGPVLEGLDALERARL